MNTIIRPANEEDYEAIYQLIKEFAAFQQSADKVSITVAQMKKDKDLFNCLVAESDTGITGFASFFYCYYSWTGKALYLDDLYVKADERKKGTGKLLLDAIIKTAAENDCLKVRWQVSGWNENGIEFYKKYGATIDSTELNCDYILKD